MTYYYEPELRHWGIKGQKWGERRFRNEDGTLTEAGKKRYYKDASKDAKEYARAKMYYGDGAGTRRKLIKATVEEKSKDKDYKEAFDRAMSEQDMDEHVRKAIKERHAADAKATAGKAIRGAGHIIAGDGAKVAGFVTVGATVLGGAYAVLKYTGYDKVLIDKGKNLAEKAVQKLKGVRFR